MSSASPIPSHPQAPAELPTRMFLLRLAVTLGVVAGLMEAVQHYVFRFNTRILAIAKVPFEGILWVAPLFYFVSFLLIALGCLVLGTVVRRWPARLSMLFACVFISAYGQLTLTNKIHKAGAAVFAAGAAIALCRWMKEREPAWRLLGRAAPALAGAIALLWAGGALVGILRERNAHASLPPAPPDAPNVLLIVLDTVRADHLSLYGYGRATTPNLDRWAQRGVTFDNAWAVTSWTLPSHASLLTGHPAWQHRADRGRRLDGRLPLLSEYLRDHGYRTGGLVGNDIWLSPEYGFGRGFLRWRVYTPWNIAARTAYGRKAYGILSERLGFHYLPVRRFAHQVSAELLDWLDNTPRRPFFALVNYFDVHDPYWPLPPYDKRFTGPPPGKPDRFKGRNLNINDYDGLIAYLDDQVSGLLDELEKRGLLANTVVMITSDHGESLGDHDQVQHGDSLYRELCRIPLIVLAPNAPAGARVEASLSLEQIPATVADLIGQRGPSPFPGRSFAPFLRGTPGAALGADETALLELNKIGGAMDSKSLVRGQWQYLWTAKDGREELYDTKTDPKELNNLAADPKHAARFEEFRSHLRKLFPELPIGKPAS